MPENKKSIKEFAQGIKSKYPQYKDMDDFELAEKMVQKYPEYKNSIDFEVKKKDLSQQDLEEPSSQVVDPSEQVSPTNGSSNQLENDTLHDSAVTQIKREFLWVPE